MASNDTLPYDKASAASIEAYALELIGQSLRTAIGEEDIRKHRTEGQMSGKGRLGQLVEELYFKYNSNSNSEPDFPEAGLELKTTGVNKLKTKDEFSAKERVSLNMINFMEEHKLTFEQSSFWRKNKHILFVFYLYEKDKPALDCIFNMVKRWEFPEEDLKIIKDDWKKIIGKIKHGQAHLLSEGDTLYLSATTKGPGNQVPVPQPFNPDENAKKRAFALKQNYITHIIRKSFKDFQPIIKDVSEYKKGETFEDKVIAKFKPFYGKTEQEIADALGVLLSKSKQRRHILSKNILGVVGKKKIEEFEKADVEMKTANLEYTGTLEQSMSFENIDYDGILDETWEDSYWYETLTKRFLLVVFRKVKKARKDDEEITKLEKVFFWTMPVDDLKKAEKFWLDTQQKVQENRFKDFISMGDDCICHVRPKGRKGHGNDTALFRGQLVDKKCYWLDQTYIKKIIEEQSQD